MRLTTAHALIAVALITGLGELAARADGEMDIEAYCQHLGYDRTSLIAQDAYGWRCVDVTGTRIAELDLIGLCAFQYGGRLPLPRFASSEDPFSWRCYEDPEHPAPLCNGDARLCGRSFDQVTFATTHNSHATYANRFALPNQPDGIANQLRAGIRGLMVDLYYDPSWRYENGRTAIRLCHGNEWDACRGGYVDLRDGLREIREFLDAHPREVVTLIVEDWVPGEAFSHVAREFEDSGLLPRYLHVQQQPADQWPTLGQMIESGRRLVVLSSRGGGSRAPWYHDEWAFAWESDFNVNVGQPSPDLHCNPKPGLPERGRTGNRLFIMNHFVSPAEPVSASRMNDVELVVARARRCASLLHRVPNFVAVDFYNSGNVVEAVRRLNASYTQ